MSRLPRRSPAVDPIRDLCAELDALRAARPTSAIHPDSVEWEEYFAHADALLRRQADALAAAARPYAPAADEDACTRCGKAIEPGPCPYCWDCLHDDSTEGDLEVPFAG